VSSQPRVVVFDPIPGDWSFDEEATILAHRGVELLVPETPEAADEAIRDAAAVIVTGIRRLDAERVRSLRDAAGILCYSIGMDKVDGAAAQAAGIPVRNVPDYCTDEVSDHALTLLLAAERRLVPIATETAKRWGRQPELTGPIRRLRGQTLGILGAGRIGRLVARKARAFGFRTIAHDPIVSDVGEPDLELVTFAELLERSDALVLCAALTPSSRGIIGHEALARVRPGLIVVNVARGELIDELALADALQDGRVGYAALDVRAPEPPDADDDPLAGLEGLLQTPHMAATSRDAIDDLHRLAARYVLELLEHAGRIPAVA
jgi:D-3-phosphoglycerate dehydrogenase / 2-oxoglutarate reductase